MCLLYKIGGKVHTTNVNELDDTYFKGKLVETYIGFMSSDKREIASSFYTGQATVL
jgi:hypothetical protein